LLSTQTLLLMDIGSLGLFFEVEDFGLNLETDWVMQRMDLAPSPHLECQPWKPALSCFPPVDVFEVQRPQSILADLLQYQSNRTVLQGSREDRQSEASSSVPYCIFSFRVVSLNGIYEGFLRNCFEH